MRGASPCLPRNEAVKKIGKGMHSPSPCTAIAKQTLVILLPFLCWIGTLSETPAQRVAPLPTAPTSTENSGKGAAQVVASEDLGNADRLSVRFRGYPDLTGDYRISSDSTIAIPVVGRISVAGLDAAGLEKLLSSRVTEIAGREGYVTVEIAAYKPIYVTGLVKNAGATQWQPGMTVLQAISLSGGISTGSQGLGAATEGSNDFSRLKKAIDDQKRTLAVLARLRAEQAGATEILAPSRLAELAGRDAAEELLARQRSILTSRRASIESQLAALERGRMLADQELDGLRAQSGRINELLKLRKENRTKIQEGLAKGLVRAERSLEEDVRVSDLEEKSTNITVGIARIQGTLAGLQREALTLRLDREAAINSEIARLERESAQLNIEIEAESRKEGSMVTSEGKPLSIEYRIVRLESQSSTTISADQSTRLKPGDVLVVSQDDKL
jgi:exopolysaccharide production protein ExoF